MVLRKMVPRQVIFHKGALGDALLTLESQEETSVKAAPVRHTESCRSTRAAHGRFGLDNLITAKLDALGQRFEVLITEIRTLHLGEQRENGRTA